MTRIDLRGASLDVTSPEFIDLHFGEYDEAIRAIPTPLPAWNEQCRDDGGGVGLALGWHVVVAANTGSGKSLLALNMGAHAMRQGWKVGFLSLEMSLAQLSTRLYAILSGVEVRALERGASFDPMLMEVADERIAEIRSHGGGFVVLEPKRAGIETLEHDMAKLVNDGCQMIVVDYLQRIGARDADSMFAAVSNASAIVDDFGKDNGVLTIGLSQFNRPTSSNRTDSPIVQGLMGTSSLENDADQVFLLDHTRSEKDEQYPHLRRTWGILGKNRSGGHGDIAIEWNYKNLTIRQAKPDEIPLWPGGKKEP